MNIKNDKKAKRFFTIAVTLIFAASVFAVTAFAQGIDTNSAVATGVGAGSSSVSVAANSEVVSGETSSGAATSSGDGTGSNITPESEGLPSSNVTSSSKASSAVSSKETASSKRQTSVASHAPIDTQTKRVEDIASQADAAVSDPDVLSSQDWGSLLSSTTQSSVQAAVVSQADTSSNTSSKTPAGGGISWLMILGIVLIVLALCGIAYFVYAQFFSDPDGHNGGRGGPKGISPSAGGSGHVGDNTKPIEFTDISSDSDGTQHRDDYVPSKEQPLPDELSPKDIVSAAPVAAPVVAPAIAPVVTKAQVANVKSPEIPTIESPAPIPKNELPAREPSVPEQNVESLPKSQATPVQDGKNFNWEEFFNDENK